MRGDYLAQARQELAGQHGVDPSPAWLRRVTGCSERLSTDLAKVLRAELAADHDSGQVEPGTNTTAATSTDTSTATHVSGVVPEVREAA